MRESGRPSAGWRPAGAALLKVGVLLATAAAAQAQLVRSIFDGATPPEVQAGAPAGSFALSDFESINLYSGKVNFALPLLRIGGRGEAGYTMTLRIERSWGFDTHFVCGTSVCGPDEMGGTVAPLPRHSAVPMETTANYDPGYSPGVLTMRTGINTVLGAVGMGSSCDDDTVDDIMEERKLTRLTFLQPDGTEISLRDKKYGGEPFVNKNATECRQEALTGSDPSFSHRGREFVAADGSATTFVSDSLVDEDSSFTEYGSEVINSNPRLGPAGRLGLRNGTIYRLEGGRVSWIRDRNGNQVSLQYTGASGGGVLSRATDSLGRAVNIAYNQSSCGTSTTLKCDKITYKGKGGANRVIEVHRQPLAEVFCSRSGTGIDNHLCPGSGTAAKTHDQLFPKNQKGGDQGPDDSRPFNPKVVSKVKLPNGKSYRFTYTIYGELYSVTLPTGGVIEYDWRPAVIAGSPTCTVTGSPAFCAGIRSTNNVLSLMRRVAERREKADGSTVSARTTYALSTRSNCITGTSVACSEVTVKHYDSATATTPLSQQSHHFYGLANNPAQTAPWEYPAWRSGKEYKTEIKSSTGTALRRTEHVWQQRQQPAWWTSPTSPNPSSAANGHNANNAPPNDVRIARTDTTLLDGTRKVSRVAYSYSSDRFNNRTDVKRYGYGSSSPGSLLNWLHTEYETRSAYTQSAANFNAAVNPNNNSGGDELKSYLPSVVTKQWLCGAGSSSCAESAAAARNEFSIDHNSLASRSSPSGHDSSGFATTYTVRGNRTRLRRWLNPGNTRITQTLTYDILGNVTNVVDFNGNTTTISYDDDFIFATNSSRPPTGTSTFAFPTTITRDAGTGKLNHKLKFKYDYDLGRQTEAKDENDYKTTFTYDDKLDRPTAITDPLDAATTFAYDDDNNIVTTTRQQDSCASTADIVGKVVFDGFGRQVRSEQRENGAKCISTIQSYDGLGRIAEVGNPQREDACLSPSNSRFLTLPTAKTRYAYDALGRVTRITHPDGSSVSTSYNSNTATVTDEAGNKRKSVRDALDRITQVTEDPGGLGYATSYSYDALDNLTRVTQGSQTRTFGYDSLGRLLCASNPESRVGSAACSGATLPTAGVDRYVYDNNSNLTRHTNTRGVAANTAYDALNRPTGINYSDTTPDVTFCYDGKDFSGSACTTTQVVGKKGRLTAARSTVSTTRYTSFDKLGRVKGSSQQTGGTTYSFSYAYNKAGGLETQTYPSGLLVKTCYDAAGRISGVSDNATPAASYASNFDYAPHGALAELKLGNNLYEYRDYNTRLQPQEIGLGTFDGGSDKLKLEFTYKTPNNNDNNGNVLKQVITRPSLTALTQSYTYDKVNRLKTAAESGAGTAWSRSYGYDRYGNRAVSANSGLPTSPLMPTAKTNFSSSTNRLTLTGARYDNSGNLTATSLGDTLAYDAENRLKSYTLSSATTTYKYGPEGRRVQKATPTVTETYVYDAFGKLAAEYSTVAPTSGGTFYRTTDHLGSTRLVTKQDKSDADCYDYAPFGEEIPNTLGSRSSNACFAASFDGRHRFTGKERDDESDLDYFLARYYSGPMGRFTSVDPENAGADPEFPQTWNAYAYVANNPLKYVDRNGEYLATAWSVANVAIGVASFASNIKQGNYVAATVDAVGVALDVAATTTGLPGGAGTALRVARAADKLATATGAARTAVKGVDAVDTATDAERVLTKAATRTDIAIVRAEEHPTL